jgi:hypothetical protein
MNRTLVVSRLLNVRLFSTKRFSEIPYDEQWESRDFRRKLTTEHLTVNNKVISDELKKILIKENPKDFGFLGYSIVKYTCKTEEEIQFEKDNPLG